MYECPKTLRCIAELDSDLQQQKACKTDHSLLTGRYLFNGTNQKKRMVFDNEIKLSKWYLAVSGVSVRITFIVYANG